MDVVMKNMIVRIPVSMALIGAMFLVSACASSIPSTPDSQVAKAFESSGAVPVRPYTRTIFSTNDF
jgi:hypothetical protein